MDFIHSTTPEHKRGEHLKFEQRVIIQTRTQDGWSPNRIAKEIGCAPNTVRNELKRGTILLHKGKVSRYKAKRGQERYEQNRKACCRGYDLLKKLAFVSFVEDKFFSQGWSFDACYGYALKEKLFTKEEMVCTKTLYAYANLNLLSIKNIHLPGKLRRSPKKLIRHKNKRILGRSIEERPFAIHKRSEFGHWEADLVIGSKHKDDDALLTLVERKTREYWMIRVPGKDPQGIMSALSNIQLKYKEHWNEVFKTITTDNGSEFSLLSRLEDVSKTLVYFTHPYTSCEKGSVERHNGLIRRFIPKKKRIDSLSDEEISRIEAWCNTLPRKVLGYSTPHELFEDELSKVYSCVA